MKQAHLANFNLTQHNRKSAIQNPGPQTQNTRRAFFLPGAASWNLVFHRPSVSWKQMMIEGYDEKRQGHSTDNALSQ